MHIVSVNLSEEKGTVKHPVPEISIDEHGVVGDAHAGPWHRQVSLLSSESIAKFEAEAGRKIRPGEFAENLTVQGTDLRSVGLLDRLTSGTVELQVCQIGKECHGDDCAIFREVGKCVMPRDGIFCRVITPGLLKPGDRIAHHQRALRMLVITMSDRASRGDYEDRSGPRVRAMLEDFLAETRWHPDIRTAILPDDADRLRAELTDARDKAVDVVFTTGGTGIGPRDITPDVVSAMADRTIPGIMEHIRVKYGETKPNALLSRGVAAILGKMLVYTLPGSEKAVREYMAEVLKTLEHVLLTVHGVAVH